MDFLRRGLLFAAQFARQPLLSAAQLAGCYSRHSLDFPGEGCYSRHRTKPLLFTAHFPFLHGKPGCYRRHSSVLGCYSRHNWQGLLSAAHLAEKPANPRLLVIDTPLHFCAGVVIHGTVSRVVKHGTVWDFSVVIRSTFCFWVVIHGTFLKLLLFTAQFGKTTGCYSRHSFGLGCYSRHSCGGL